jgi:hypothetical protein
MSVTATDLQNLVITRLSNADPTALTGLQFNVPKYWQLWNRQGVLPELQYYYTYREAIRYLMACLNQQVDYARRTQSASRNMTASSLANDTMTATGIETATSLANRSSSSAYSDVSNSTGTGSGASNRSASQVMNANSSMSDTGSGANASSQASTLTSSSSVNASSCDSMASDQMRVTDVAGEQKHLTRSDKRSVGAAIVGAGVTENFSATFEEMPIANNTTTNINTSGAQSQYIARQNSQQVNALLQTSTQSSSSHFNSNRVSSDTMTGSGSSVMTSSSSSSFSMAGSGSGSMTGTGAGGSSMTASSSRVSVARGEAHRLAVNASASNSTMERLHQRFLHLQELWKQANETIKWFEAQRLGLTPYVLQALVTQYPDGINAAAANQMLVKTPYGTPRMV